MTVQDDANAIATTEATIHTTEAAVTPLLTKLAAAISTLHTQVKKLITDSSGLVPPVPVVSVSSGTVPMPSLTTGTNLAKRPTFSSPILTWQGPVGGGPSNGDYTLQTQTLTTSGVVSSTGPNTVIENLNISGNSAITINHNNVTVRKCHIIGPGNSWVASINIATGVKGTIVEDCFLDGQGTSYDTNAISSDSSYAVNGITVRRCHFSGYGQCLRYTLNNANFIENYCEKLAGPDSDYVEIYPNGTSCNNILIQYNYFTGPDNIVNGGDSAINMTTGSGLPLGPIGPNIVIDSNWMVRTEATQADAWQFHSIVNDRSSGSSLEWTGTNNGFFSAKAGAVWSSSSSGSATIGSGLIHDSGNYLMSTPTSRTGPLINGTGKF